MPWYTTADARRDAEKQSASKNRENSVRDNEGPSMNDMEREYRQLCRIDETPGVQGLAQLGRNAIERVAQLEKELAAAVAERDELARRNGNLSVRLAGAVVRLSAIDSAPVVAHIANKIGPDYFPCGLTILADRKLPPLGTELIARPAKD